MLTEFPLQHIIANVIHEMQGTDTQQASVDAADSDVDMLTVHQVLEVPPQDYANAQHGGNANYNDNNHDSSDREEVSDNEGSLEGDESSEGDDTYGAMARGGDVQALENYRYKELYHNDT